MGKIKILPLHEAQKIAAGEIVERPANVVKELFENALDAGATQLTLQLEKGGKKSIICIDNGCGMAQDDARLSIHNHATSKLSSIEELDTIATFGFRGEALASIAAVSTMKLTTKTADMAEGIRLTIQAGDILQEEFIGANTGTIIEIHDLFYNLPVRHKFLKKDETEWNTIYLMFQALCLSHRNCSCSLYHNDQLIFNAPGTSSLQQRIEQVCDAQFASKTTPCSMENNKQGFSLSGFISHPSYHRYDRNHLFFFVNNRWIKNPKLAQAFIKAYASMLPEKRYPAGVIMITIDPLLIDVNIHPRKEEVQFVHPVVIETAIEKMVRQALQQSVSSDIGLSSAAAYTKNESPYVTQTLFEHKKNSGEVFYQQPKTWNFGPNPEPPSPHVITQKTVSTPLKLVPEASCSEPETVQHDQMPLKSADFSYRLIGQLHTTYILIETDEGIVLIDQHAAHERILYELFSQKFDQLSTVQLMFPTLITISSEEHQLIQPWLYMLSEQGILIDELKQGTLIIKSVPVALKNANFEQFVMALIAHINENAHFEKDALKRLIYHEIRAMMACKAAIKAGDVLDDQHMHELIVKLHKTENRMTCPHGRPTLWVVSLYDIEKKFKRVV